MILALPWVLLTLAAMPALAAIYLLRNRSRRQPVSSLMLWMDLTRPREGGRRLKRMQVPLLLLLELLALGFLGLASAGPYVRAAGASRPLVIVLDDSFSMRAGGEDSSRARAVRAVEETLRAEPDASVQFILAGSAPQMLGDRAADLHRAGELLARWRCLAPAASLDAAVSLAATVGGRTARILVCTDRPPPREISEGRVLWRAFGRQSPNVAIVNAARSVHEGRDRCLVELANYSDDRARAVLTLSADAVPAALATRAVDLPAGEKATLFFEVPADTKIVYARLGNDALGLDNKVTLLPDAGRPVRMALRLENPALREAVQRALEASGRARLTAAGAELLVTDGAPPPDRAGNLVAAVHRGQGSGGVRRPVRAGRIASPLRRAGPLRRRLGGREDAAARRTGGDFGGQRLSGHGCRAGRTCQRPQNPPSTGTLDAPGVDQLAGLHLEPPGVSCPVLARPPGV